MYPDDCIQSIIKPSDWWIENKDNKICRGALIKAFVPHVDQLPYTFEPIGRKDATHHEDAVVKVAPLKIDQHLKQVDLPVAAMPLYSGEVWAAYRAKRRPCLVIGMNDEPVDKALTKGKPKHATAPTLHVAPFYGVGKNIKRAGYSEEFVERVRHCEYSRFVWDCLPTNNGCEESILRLDHIQPIGSHYGSYQVLNYKLSESALELIDDLIHWLIWGGIDKDSLIALYRSEIEDMFGA